MNFSLISCLIFMAAGFGDALHVTKLEIHTDDQALGVNDAVVFRVHDRQTASCLTSRFDSDDGFDLDTVDTIGGTDLGNCGDDGILSGSVKEVVVSHEGQEAWSFRYIKVFTDDGRSCTTWAGQVQGGVLNFELPCDYL